MEDQQDQSQENEELEIGKPEPQAQVFDEDGIQQDDEDLEALELFESLSGEKQETKPEEPKKEEKPAEEKTKPEVEESDDQSAVSLAEKRARELGGEPPPEQNEEDEVQKAIDLLKSKGVIRDQEQEQPQQQRQEPQRSGQRKKVDVDSVVQYLSSIDDDNLPDVPVKIGDREINIKEFKEDLPETWDAARIAAATIVKAKLEEMIESGEIIPAEKVAELQNDINTKINQVGYWLTLISHHSDALKLRGDKHFNNWLDKKGPLWVKMASAWNPEDALLVLNAYKEETGRSAAKTFDEKQKKVKQDRDALHTHTARGPSVQPTSRGPKSGEVDEEKLFNEAANSLQR